MKPSDLYNTLVTNYSNRKFTYVLTKYSNRTVNAPIWMIKIIKVWIIWIIRDALLVNVASYHHSSEAE